MIELRATIEAGDNLLCWTKAIQNISKLSEHITVELKNNEIVLSAFNSSRTVFEIARFPSSFFRGFRYGRVVDTQTELEDESADINQQYINEEEEELFLQPQESYRVVVPSRLQTRTNTNTNTHSGTSISTETMTDRLGSISFELQSKFIIPIFRKVEKDGSKIHQLRLRLVDEPDEDEQAEITNMHDGIKNDQFLGRASVLEIQILTHSKIRKSYQLACLNPHKSVFHAGIDQSNCPCRFAFESQVLKRYMDYMSLKADEFSFTFYQDEVSMVSRSPYIEQDREVLKNSLHTEIIARYEDLDYVKVVFGMCLVFRIKELRSFVLLGESFTGSLLKAVFKEPNYPLTFDLVGPSIPRGVEIQAVFTTNGTIYQAEGGGDNTEQEWVVRDNTARRVGRDPVTSSTVADHGGSHVYAATTQTQNHNETQARPRSRSRSKSGISRVRNGETTGASQDSLFVHDAKETQYEPHEPQGLQEDGDDEPQTVQWGGEEHHQTMVAQDEHEFDDIDEMELDREIEIRKSQLGPTQNQSQARGLFDDSGEE